jgi:hypothetical protein
MLGSNLVAVLLFAAGFLGACQKTSSRVIEKAPTQQPQEASKTLNLPVEVNPSQKASLEDLLRSAMVENLSPVLTEKFLELDPNQASLFGETLAKGLASDLVRNLQNSEFTEPCGTPGFGGFDSSWAQCLLRNWSSEGEPRLDVFQAFFEEANVAPPPAVLLSKVALWIVSPDSTFLNSVLKTFRAQARSLELLLKRGFVSDAPFLAESFFKNRKFVFTTSFAQGSVGRERMYNLANHMVRLEVRSGQLVILRDGSDLSGSSNFVDVIETSYPVLQTLVAGKETYFQVDFSAPRNKEFLVMPLLGGVPQLSLSADVVVPRVSFAPKSKLAKLNSALYVNATDSELVVDSLVLLNGSNEALTPNADGVPDFLLDKDTVRPTVRVFQGLFAWNSDFEAFSTSQAMSVETAAGQLAQAGADLSMSGGSNPDVPFFETGGRLLDDGGRDRLFLQMARKFSNSKPIVWVLSKNTPAKAIPAVKASVNVYATLFEKMKAEGAPVPQIVALTEAEFLASEEATARGIDAASLHAADPRVNMILWDESKSLGAAWATAVGVPTTGQVISADVMLSGTMWAKEGCMGFLRSQWSTEKEPKTTKRKMGPVPSAGSRMLWDFTCEATLFTLGIYASRDTLPDLPGGSPLPPLRSVDLTLKASEIEKVLALTRKGNAKELDAWAHQLAQSKKESDGAAKSFTVDSASVRKTVMAALSSQDELSQKGTLSRFLSNGSFSKVWDVVKFAESSLTAQRANKSREALFEGGNGENKVKANLDCYLPVGGRADLELSGIGAPKMESPFVKSASDGALALLRSTLVHELGHAFGLRHNFAGSLAAAKLQDSATPVLAPYPKTDSMMDYNDYAHDLEMGAMEDYTSPSGVGSQQSFGAYDYLALGSLYKLDTKSFQFETKPMFCTDRNVGLVNNCQRYDFGKNYVEFLVNDMNMVLARLQNAQASDLILFDAGTLLGRPLGRFLDDLSKISTVFGVAQHEAFETNLIDQKRALIDVAELAFRARGATQGFVTGFEKRMGRPLLGLYEVAQISQNVFDEPAFGEILADVIRAETALGIIGVNNSLKSQGRDQGSDGGFFGAIHDVRAGGEGYNYLSELLELYASRVVVPAGSPVSFSYFADGLKKGEGATIQGKPLRLTLTEPFFNHVQNHKALKEVEIDDPQNAGQTMKVAALVSGNANLSQMVVDLATAATLSGGFAKSPSAARMAKDLQFVDGLLSNFESCGSHSDSSSRVACEGLSESAFPMANVVREFYKEALQLASQPN